MGDGTVGFPPVLERLAPAIHSGQRPGTAESHGRQALSVEVLTPEQIAELTADEFEAYERALAIEADEADPPWGRGGRSAEDRHGTLVHA